MPDQQPRIGTGFTNLQNIMSANQGNQLGSAVGQGITDVANNAKNNLNQSENQFQTGIGQAQNQLASEQNETNQTFNNIANNPSAVTQQQATDFQNIGNLQYTGPNGLSNQQQLAGQAQDATQLGQLTQSGGGKQQLLNRFAASNQVGYGQGARDLDTTLLGQGGQQQLQDARKQTQGLNSQVQNQSNAAQQQAQAQQGALQQYQQGAQQQLQQAQQGNQNDINQSVQQLQGQVGQQKQYLQDAQNNINAIAQGGGTQLGLAQGRLANAGYSQDQINQITSLVNAANGDPNALATIANSLQVTAPASINAQNGASSQQAAQANALAMLSGSAPVYNNYNGPATTSTGLAAGSGNTIAQALQPDIFKGVDQGVTGNLASQQAQLADINNQINTFQTKGGVAQYGAGQDVQRNAAASNLNNLQAQQAQLEQQLSAEQPALNAYNQSKAQENAINQILAGYR